MPDDHAQRCSDCLEAIDGVLIEYLRAGRVLRMAMTAAGFRKDRAGRSEARELVRKMGALREDCHGRLDVEKKVAVKLGVGKAAWHRIEHALDRDEAETRAMR